MPPDDSVIKRHDCTIQSSAAISLGFDSLHLNCFQGNQDRALELLEDCAIAFFDVKDKRVCDPNLLYR